MCIGIELKEVEGEVKRQYISYSNGQKGMELIHSFNKHVLSLLTSLLNVLSPGVGVMKCCRQFILNVVNVPTG